MQNYECMTCHGLCDPGELIGNICIECREKEEKEDSIQVHENGYGSLSRQHIKSKRRAYEEAEREDMKNGEYYGGHYTGECENFV